MRWRTAAQVARQFAQLENRLNSTVDSKLGVLTELSDSLVEIRSLLHQQQQQQQQQQPDLVPRP